MIAIFDEDGGGDVDFQEFVSGLSAFSSKGNKEQKLRFAFKVYDIDRDGYISNGELFIVLKMMVGSNLKDQQLQQIVDKTIMEADLDKDGKISFEEFTRMVETTDVSMSMTLGEFVVTLVPSPEALQRSAFQVISWLTYCPLLRWGGPQINSNCLIGLFYFSGKYHDITFGHGMRRSAEGRAARFLGIHRRAASLDHFPRQSHRNGVNEIMQ